MEIGRKVYYEKASGNVIWVTDQRMGLVVETTVEQDFAFYSALAGRVPETVGLLQLEFDDYAADYDAGGQINRIDLETMEPLFTYPDPTDPETPQEPRPALSKEIEALKTADVENKEAIAILYEMQLGAGLDA
jgi:hypothetical protein